MPIGKVAQGRPEEGLQQGQPCHRCLSGHHHHQPSLRGPPGHSCKHRGRMMICTSVHLECVVRMHGWAIKYRTTNRDLPFCTTLSDNHPPAVPPCLSHQELGNNDPKDGSLAPKGKTLHRSTQKSQEILETGQRTAKQSQRPNTLDLPVPDCLCRLLG
jgi:hypothetical protein